MAAALVVGGRMKVLLYVASVCRQPEHLLPSPTTNRLLPSETRVEMAAGLDGNDDEEGLPELQKHAAPRRARRWSCSPRGRLRL